MSLQPANDSFTLPNNYDRRVRYVTELLGRDPCLRSRDLAKFVEVTPSHLERLFRKQIGMSIGEFSLELRLQRARKCLETTFQSLKEIRHDAGIPDAANFSRLFKKRFGMTPSAYRERMSVSTNKYQN